MSLSPTGRWRGGWNQVIAYSASLLGVIAALALTYALPPLQATPNVLFFAVVVAAAWLGGIGPAILAIVVSTLVVDFILLPPFYSLLSSVADVIRLVEFVFVAIVILYLQENYRKVADHLRDANELLEARVQERTTDLVAANESLRNEIEERHAAEVALKESESNLRLALDGVEASLKEKEVLFRELHHRVKNNLQIITSILSLQRTRIQDPTCQELFRECQQRVRAIALLHQRLCGAQNLASIDLASYFDQLVQEVFRSYYVGAGIVSPKVVVDTTAMDIDRLIPCALIVNELVCNAFKYAFPEGRSGEVQVEVRHADGQIHLIVSDDGVGNSSLEQLQSSGGVGLQIVLALVDQLSGKLCWANGRGTSATITFPESS